MAPFILFVAIGLLSTAFAMTTESVQAGVSTPGMPTTELPTTPGLPTTDLPVTPGHSGPLHCYSCKFTNNLQFCRFAKTCSAGSECLMGELTSGQFYLDCAPAPACQYIPTQIQSKGSGSYLGQTFKRFDCCSQNKCNRNDISPVG